MRAGLHRDKVIGAAARLADRYGFAELTLKRLATDLGVRPLSLFNHFKSLADVRQALALLAVDTLSRELSKAMAGKAGEQAVEALCHAYRAFATAHPGLDAAMNVPPKSRAFAAKEAELLALFAAALVDFQLAKNETIHLIRGLRAFIAGFASIERAGGFALGVAPETSFRWLVEQLRRARPG